MCYVRMSSKVMIFKKEPVFYKSSSFIVDNGSGGMWNSAESQKKNFRICNASTLEKAMKKEVLCVPQLKVRCKNNSAINAIGMFAMITADKVLFASNVKYTEMYVFDSFILICN